MTTHRENKPFCAKCGGECLYNEDGELKEKHKIKCAICDEEIEETDDTILERTIEGELACPDCYESESEYPSMLNIFSPDGNEEIRFTTNFGVIDGDGEFGYMPSPIKLQKWVNSGGWRGYTDWELLDGFVKIADGWITGYPDESTTRKKELGEYFEDLKEEKITPPVPIYWIFGTTSNVFSQVSCIVVRESDVKAIEEWLLKINGGLEEFAEKFN